MNIGYTQWSPDTCKCVIEYQYDKDLKPHDMVISVSKIISKCEFHQNHSDDATHYASVLSENQSKNKAIGIIADSVPGFKKVDENGNVSIDTSKLQFSFDVDRKVIITVDGTDQQKTDAQSALDSQLGAGKASIS